MRLTSEIQLTMESIEDATNLFEILNPEIKSDSRVQTSLSRFKNKISLSINAADRNAARSAINSYGKWIKLYEEIGGIE